MIVLAFALDPLDLVMLAAYFVVVVLAGVWSMRRVRNAEDYFIGGRRFGKFFMAFTNFGSTVSSDGPILVADQTFRSGFSGIWINLFWIILTPYTWMRALWFRRLRYVTDADFFEDRYESLKLATLFSVFAAIYFSVLISVGLTAMGDSIVGILSLHDSFQSVDSESLFLLVLCVTVTLTLVYGVCGGLTAAIITDFIQSLFMIFLSFVVIPLAYVQCSGMAGIRQAVPDHLWDMFGSAQASAYTWYSVIALVFLALAGLPATPGNMLVNAARDERSAQIGVVVGLFIKRFCTLAWAIVGLLAIVLLHQSEVGKNQVYGVMTMRMLAPLGLGLIGLVIAGLLGALMSTADTMMVAAGATVTQNIYKPFLAPDHPERHYVRVGRVVSAMVILLAACIALNMRDVLEQFKLTLTLQLVFGPVVWLGLFWRRANAKAATATVVLSAIVLFVVPKLACYTSLATDPRYVVETRKAQITYRSQIATPYDVERGLASRVGETFSFTEEGPSVPVYFTALEIDETGQATGAGFLRIGISLFSLMGVPVEQFSVAALNTLDVIFSIVFPFAVMYAVGRTTRPQDKQKLDRFFARMLTPVVSKSQTLDQEKLAHNIERFDKMRNRHLFPSSDWVIEKPDKFTAYGLVVVCGIAALFIGLVWFITLIGRG